MTGDDGRGDRIRTYGLLLPKQALYQAELHPVRRSGGAMQVVLRQLYQCIFIGRIGNFA